MGARMKKMVKDMVKKMVGSRGDQRGFTLVEVMVAMALLAYVMSGVMMVNLYSQRSGLYARRLTSANIIAEGLLEKCRNTDYDNLPPYYNGKTVCFDVNMEEVACSASAAFTRASTVQIDVPDDNITRVSVTVTWPDSMPGNTLVGTEGKWPYQVDVVSYITRY